MTAGGQGHLLAEGLWIHFRVRSLVQVESWTWSGLRVPEADGDVFKQTDFSINGKRGQKIYEKYGVFLIAVTAADRRTQDVRRRRSAPALCKRQSPGNYGDIITNHRHDIISNQRRHHLNPTLLSEREENQPEPRSLAPGGSCWPLTAPGDKGVQPFIELTGEWTHQHASSRDEFMDIWRAKAKCPLETVQQKIETVSELMRTQVQRGQETTSVP
uniref:Uncharacterized protein n=1 Tax=Knipowitschia caucasica TaxID=637954 RepID=A0AAV2LFC3_KNICA